MKKSIFITLLVFYSFNGISQCKDITIKNRIYPEVCVANAIKWINMPRNQWHNEMKNYDFSSIGTCEGSPCYYTGSELDGSGVLYAITKEFGLLRIENIPLETKKKHL